MNSTKTIGRVEQAHSSDGERTKDRIISGETKLIVATIFLIDEEGGV